jgi:membrane-bound lytic murein transglycosylase A
MDTVRKVKSVVACVILSVAALLAGCKTAPAGPDYGRPLPPGASALVKLDDPSRWPDLREAFQGRDADLLQAVARSRAWFDKPSTVRHFPIEGITHAQAAQSLAAFEALLAASPDYNFFRQRLAEQFDCYMSVGWDGQGEVLFTGYYSPIFEAARQRTAEFRHPLYNRPADLVSDPVTGQILGRQAPGGRLEPYPTRQQIERDPAALGLVGRELVWLRTRLDAYIIQVNGSARLRMRDGSVMHIGYAGTNGREYSSLGEMLVADGKLHRDQVSLPAIRRYFDQRPHELDAYIQRNDRFVFFTTYDGGNWPAGSLGFAVMPWRSLATDKAIFPRGGVMLVRTQAPTTGGGTRAFSQWMLDQDTGGAIRAPGRADIYMGVGPSAEELAGRQAAVGRMYYFFLKPRFVAGPQVN